MGLALFGLAVVAFEVAMAWRLAAQLRKQGRSQRIAFVRLLRPGPFWFALVLVVGAVSEPAGAVVFGMMMLVTAVFVVLLLVRGVRGLPEFARNVRRIGDPDAWRGTPHP